MKFLLFSDIHHYPGVFTDNTWEGLEEIQDRAEKENCDFIIHAGDMCHGPSLVPDYVKAYNDFHIPSYHCLGNHDTDETPYEETLKYYNMPNGYYFFDQGGYRMIVLNPNYYYVDGQYHVYSMGNYYANGEHRDYMPPEQLKWLEETIASAPGPCILISHESFERPDGVKNREEVLKIINEANQRKPHSVLMCINGHHHRDFIRIMENVCYFEINSASFEWLHLAHNCYPEEMCREIRHLNHILAYDDPIFCVVTIEGTSIRIDGMKSTLFMDVTVEMTGNLTYDRAGRRATPEIQSATITL